VFGWRTKLKVALVVELLIVVLILGALAAIALPRIMGGANNARINACLTNIEVLNSQTELYNANEGAWPADVAELTNALCIKCEQSDYSAQPLVASVGGSKARDSFYRDKSTKTAVDGRQPSFPFLAACCQ